MANAYYSDRRIVFAAGVQQIHLAGVSSTVPCAWRPQMEIVNLTVCALRLKAVDWLVCEILT
jgi:hypothetical protein